eukprot:TRINITY_DN7008_c0_g1_i2.p1 TRINITY_DN7008_c0_g1~~TRINITY_DN7008_c0_g1_i2.p1  ORF type:complete len:441 (+),score=98.36 TRINITY_DN7008_c0_g1_i2:59-1381(+)
MAREESGAAPEEKPHTNEAPRTTEYEFNGPVGALGVVLGLPLTVFALYFACNAHGCLPLLSLHLLPQRLPTDLSSWISLDALGVVVAWILFQAVLLLALPGPEVHGVKLRDGSSLTYKLNGFAAFVVSAVAVGGLYFAGALPLAWLAANFVQLAAASILVSFALSGYLYATSFAPNRMLALGGNTGNAIYDFFIGRELNPRIGSFDLKEFCELRPGLIGWVVLNFAMAAHQYEQEGFVSVNLWLVCAFQALYVADALWFESAILTTMDITTDGFGFMLAFGDLVWVPFTYTMQARYLATVPDAPTSLSTAMLTCILLMKAVGYFVFRGANGQKDKFRTNPQDPSVKHLKTMKTERGTQLIISSWWGLVRHPNYVGDWLMAWSWCLPCGFNNILPYFYVIYFGILLVHREIRDEHNCHKKYGKDWDKYCGIVRYRLIPYVF